MAASQDLFSITLQDPLDDPVDITAHDRHLDKSPILQVLPGCISGCPRYGSQTGGRKRGSMSISNLFFNPTNLHFVLFSLAKVALA